jgi:hypothetical protein
MPGGDAGVGFMSYLWAQTRPAWPASSVYRTARLEQAFSRNRPVDGDLDLRLAATREICVEGLRSCGLQVCYANSGSQRAP